MATTSGMAKAAIYAVESENGKYLYNLGGAFAIGYAHWHGPRARNLIYLVGQKHKEGYQIMQAAGGRFLKWMQNQGPDNTTLTKSEQATIQKAMGTEDAKLIQDNLMMEDLNDYYAAAGYPTGVGKTDNRGAAMYAVMHHLGPAAAMNALARCSNKNDLEKVTAAMRGSSVLGQYSNRIDKAYQMIKAGSEDPTGSAADGTPGGGDDGAQAVFGATLKNVVYRGGWMMVAYKRDGGNIRLSPDASGEVWWASEEDTGIGGDGGTGSEAGKPSVPSEAPAAGSKEKALWDWCYSRRGKFAYSQGPGRTDPDKSGVTDCSGMTRRAYLDVTGQDIGYSTREQYNSGSQVASGSGRIPDSVMKKVKMGDIIVMTWNGGGNHVEMMKGNGSVEHIGQPGPGAGPKVGSDIRSYVSNTSRWSIRRYI